MKAACVILAAGQGKRMRSQRVKVLHPVCGRPMIDYPVSLALARRYAPVVVVVGRQAAEVQAHLGERFGRRVRFALQDPPRGTGHAVLCATEALAGVRGKLVILSGDVPLLTGAELGALERAGRRAAVAFLTCRLDDPRGYGRVVRDRRGAVERIVEQADASPAERRLDEINTGIYLVDAAFALRALRRVRRANAQGEYYLTDLVRAARRAGLAVAGVELGGGAAAAVLGVNDRAELSRAGRDLNRRLLAALMARGVSVVDPDTTWVEAGVRVGQDSVLLPGCTLSGDTRVGRGCRLGPGAVLHDARLADGVEVRAYSVLEGCRIGRRAQVGPFARLRPGSVLEAEVRVGNFVEVKKSRLGRGTKASHLSYLGDATIGREVNVGAGTITCNYDGERKLPTEIGDGAFIGSDTQLVAPVRVGTGAYVGAGTTVTIDVPDEATLHAIARHFGYETL
ncbi:MAG TPA: bifunctional UDP-N-acetylglucosamine diphosphorylase/glucosamine-1-phosphate N-acetyltransferase GlmU, partial [Myxococcota bacterium]|nr:bifunctional UDP-N-acetylglucosamine diphosphorylase/glucosamine-1-phosphate N-acetyltransferase GlmU [Myxococcota bacterium]